MRAYEVRYAIDDYHHASVRFGPSVARVRYDALMSVRDAYPDVSFKDIRVRYVGERETPRQIAERRAAAFNRRYQIGTRVECTPFLDDEEYAFCTRVIAPGAFITGDDQVVVKISGDAYAVESVFPIAECTR